MLENVTVGAPDPRTISANFTKVWFVPDTVTKFPVPESDRGVVIEVGSTIFTPPLLLLVASNEIPVVPVPERLFPSIILYVDPSNLIPIAKDAPAYPYMELLLIVLLFAAFKTIGVPASCT